MIILRWFLEALQGKVYLDLMIGNFGLMQGRLCRSGILVKADGLMKREE